MAKEPLTFVTDEFAEALRQYVDLSSKSMVEAVNKKARDLCFAAAKNAKNATKTKIKKIDPNPKDWKRATPGRPKYAKRILYARAVEGTKFGKAKKGKGVNKLATKLYDKRLSSIGYNKALWYKVAKDLGARLRGKFSIDDAKASGRKAKETDPAALLELSVLDIGLQDRCLDQIKQAMPKVAADMEEYINRKLSKAAEKHSGKR